MALTKEDWVKPRGKGQHLTEEEIQVVQKGYRDGTPAKEIARALQCSRRVIYRYFSKFKGVFPSPDRRHRSKPEPVQHPKFDPVAAREKRFYRGSFEL